MLRGHTANIVAIDMKNDVIISGSKDNTVNLTSIKDGKMEYSLEAHQMPIVDVAFSKGNELVFASAAYDYTVKIWKIIKTRN
ncbi:AChain A, Ika8 [Histomonas meleagridis]|uniref:AChain A, Ika8 n=1 Tax=Histomonas meleagridis TaxID=135588 RepID=UPI003559C73F|nr:AChain A, Ika8 [Histomonas meleagridis]KAH0801218.1 AChain A, Ika8 [Histomonas meleagridis]